MGTQYVTRTTFPHSGVGHREHGASLEHIFHQYAHESAGTAPRADEEYRKRSAGLCLQRRWTIATPLATTTIPRPASVSHRKVSGFTPGRVTTAR